MGNHNYYSWMAKNNSRVHVDNVPILVKIARIFHTEQLQTIGMHMKTYEFWKIY